MNRTHRRSGWGLCAAGVLGLVFFWLTDPRFGPFHGWRSLQSAVEASNQAILGTAVGTVGSLLVLLAGLWLLIRRPA